MQFFTITALTTLLAVVAQAAPRAQPRQFEVQITFEGATPEALYTLPVPTDGSTFTITNPLSISHIQSAGGASCTFTGIDGSSTTVVGAETVDVGPPQTQVSGSCLAL